MTELDDVSFKSNKLNYLSSVYSFQNFIDEWDKNYQSRMNDISLFNPELTKELDDTKKQLFIRILYHIRGHFDDLLWYMGNFAPDNKTKQMILSNIRDEFNPNGLSHEQLYLLFAKSFNVDLSYELIEEKYYYPFAREYIKGQLRWLRDNDWNSRLAAFAAIERLDNVDYLKLREVAVSMGAQQKDLTFFNIHINADHFENILLTAFIKLWKNDELLVKSVFDFISNYQIHMWQNLSDTVFNYQESH